MKFIKTQLKNLYVIEPEPFEDERGLFFRVYCVNELKKIGHFKEIMQINQSLTIKKGSLRGMHFQYPPKTEIKLVKCLKGSVFDVAIDIRNNSSSFLQWHGEIISSENKKMMYIPEGFAHGFQTLEENCEIIYFVTEFYSSEKEGIVRYNDPKVNIEWPLEVSDISKKDSEQPLLDDKFKGILV